MKKRIVAALLIAVLCIASTGCTKKEETSTENEALTYWVAMPSQLQGTGLTFNDLPMYDEYKKRMEMDVEFIHPPIGQEDEKFSLMIASGNLTDIVEYDWSKYPGGLTKAVNDNTIIALDDFIEEHAPNMYRIIEEVPGVKRDITTADGHYYGFPKINIIEPESKEFTITSGGLWLRKDWLDAIGMDVPTTIKEWDEVLYAFKDKLGKKAPLALPIGRFEGTMGHFNSAYNFALSFFVDGNKVKYAPLVPEYKDFIGQFAKWYKDGILDPEFATLTNNAVISQVQEGRSGAFWGYIGNHVGKILEAKKDDTEFELVAVPYPVAEDGGDGKCYIETLSRVAANYACITNKCKEPLKASKWLDYVYSREGNTLFTMGIEGLTYEIVDGFAEFTELITNNPDGLSNYEARARYGRGYSSGFGCGYPIKGTLEEREARAKKKRDESYPYQVQRDAHYAFNVNGPTRLDTLLPNLEYEPEIAEEITNIKFDVETYMMENITRFITGDRPMSEWDKFVGELKGLNVDKLLKYMQDAYDQYLAK